MQTYIHAQTLCQVFAQTDGEHQHDFDGLSMAIINRNNKVLFTHELLHNTWVAFTKSRTSFTGQWNIHCANFLYASTACSSEDRQTITEFLKKKSSYKLFKQACFDWKRLLSLDLSSIFACQCQVVDTDNLVWLYDNICNLEISACIRDPSLLKHNINKTDDFHQRRHQGGHKECSPYCGSKECAALQNCNTSYIEQVNAVMGNMKTTAAHSTQDTCVDFMEGVVMLYNLQQVQKNKERVMPIMQHAVKQCDATCISIKRNKALIQLPHEKPVVVPGQRGIYGAGVEKRMVIPDHHSRRVLAQLLSKEGATLTDATKYLRSADHIHPSLIPYTQWVEFGEDRVRLAPQLRTLGTVLKHFSSNSCELQHIPALVLPVVKAIMSGCDVGTGDMMLLQTYSPGSHHS